MADAPSRRATSKAKAPRKRTKCFEIAINACFTLAINTDGMPQQIEQQQLVNDHFTQLRTPDRGYSVPNLKVSDDSSATHPECSDGKGPALPHSHDRSASVPNISEDLGESRHHIPGTASAPGLGSQSASVSSATAVGAKSKTKPTKTKTKLRHRFYAARQKVGVSSSQAIVVA